MRQRSTYNRLSGWVEGCITRTKSIPYTYNPSISLQLFDLTPRLPTEVVCRLDRDEKKVAKSVIENILIKQDPTLALGEMIRQLRESS